MVENAEMKLQLREAQEKNEQQVCAHFSQFQSEYDKVIIVLAPVLSTSLRFKYDELTFKYDELRFKYDDATHYFTGKDHFDEYFTTREPETKVCKNVGVPGCH